MKVVVLTCSTGGGHDACANYIKKELKSIASDRLIIEGFVNNMNDYIANSVIIISKPSGFTTVEIATMRKPLIHVMPIPGVETCNANFFC